MSGFFGIFRPQGGPVDLEPFEQMKTAMQRDGFDGMQTYVEEKIAIGHLMLRVSPESKYDKQPLKSSCGNFILVGHFRLDYRDELGDKLGLTQSELNFTPDSQLAMLAYLKWKEKCVEHIEGDWAFAIFSQIDISMFFAKDRGGYSALFFINHNDTIYFSSDLNALVNPKVLPVEIDENQLCRIGITGVELTNGMTLFKNIHHVKSASFICINSKVDIFEKEYWQLSFEESIHYKYDLDCFLDFQSLMAMATANRSRSIQEVGVLLSSGLDSTTVAYLSANELKHKNKKLVSYTSYPKYFEFDGIKDSYRLREDLNAKEFVNEFQNVEGNFLNFADSRYSKLFFDEIHNDYYSPFLTNNTFWLNGIYGLANEKNVKNILNGQLGNFTISWNAPGLDLFFLVKLRFRTLFKRTLVAAAIKDFLLIDYLKRKVYRPLRIFLKLLFLRIGSGEIDILLSKSIITRTFNNSFKLIIEKKDFGFLPGITPILNPRKLRYEIFKKNFTNIGMKWYGSSHSYAVQSADPTSDSRLVKFSFSIDEQFFSKEAEEKYILRNIMHSKIPDYILSQAKSYIQSSDIGRRLIEDDELFSILNEMKKNKKFQLIVDLSELETNLSQISSSKWVSENISLSEKTIKILSIFCFLKKFNYI